MITVRDTGFMLMDIGSNQFKNKFLINLGLNCISSFLLIIHILFISRKKYIIKKNWNFRIYGVICNDNKLS